jgi:hypothetical protein
MKTNSTFYLLKSVALKVLIIKKKIIFIKTIKL